MSEYDKEFDTRTREYEEARKPLDDASDPNDRGDEAPNTDESDKNER